MVSFAQYFANKSFALTFYPLSLQLCHKTLQDLLLTIINMFKQGNNKQIQLASSHPLFATENRRLMGREYSKKKQRQVEREELISGTEKGLFELECKKQIKHFLKCIGRSQCANWLQGCFYMTSSLFVWGNKQQRQKLLSSCSLRPTTLQLSLNYNKIDNIVSKGLSKHNIVILIVRFRLSRQSNQQITIDLQLVSTNAKIIYKKINLKSWQDIHSEVEKAKAGYCKILFFIANKQLIKNVHQSIQMCNYLQHFYEIQTFTGNSPLNMVENGPCDQQQIITSRAVYQIIEKHQYIKAWWLLKIIKKDYQILNTAELLALTLAFNIISNLNISRQKPMEGQIEPYRQIVVATLSRELYNYRNKVESQKANDSHYPGTLANAHNCRMCGKRGYYCCPTCKKTQKKQVPLCLVCYGYFHQQLQKSNVNAQMLGRMQAWEQMDEEVQKLICSNNELQEEVVRLINSEY